MKITKKIEVTIEVDDEDHNLCDYFCNYCDPSDDRTFCFFYGESIPRGRRCSKCIKEFGKEGDKDGT